MPDDLSMPDEIDVEPVLGSEEAIARIVAYDECLATGKIGERGRERTLSELPEDLRAELGEVLDCLEVLHRVRNARLEETLTWHHPFEPTEPVPDDSGEFFSSLKIGRFEILEEIGQGGHGVVFLANDPVLKRRVAIKVPRPEFILSPEMSRRFVREAQAAAALDHPNILRVYEAGLDGAVSYIAQELCTGPTLSEWLRRQIDNVDPLLAATIILALARGTDYAHQKGVLHRDLKPSNVLLQPVRKESAGVANPDDLHAVVSEVCTAFAFTPKLCDFGIAKLIDEENLQTATQSGTVLGTAAYMSPEQAAGRTAEIGKASDVYGLGAILYELLAGGPPFQFDSPVGILQKVLADDPAPLQSRDREVPADLEAICLKCLEKQPTDRYSTAGALADDLQRFLNHEGVTARPLGRAARMIRRVRRQKFSFRGVLAGIGLLAVVAAFTIGWTQWRAEREQERKIQQFQRQKEDEQHIALLREYPDDVRLASQILDAEAHAEPDRRTVARRSRALLEKHIPRDGKVDSQGFAWHYLWKVLHQAEYSPKLHLTREIPAHRGEAYFASFSPDGRLLASAGADGKARIWDVETGKENCELIGHTGEVNWVEFAPDGKTLATASDDHTVRLWNAQSGQQLRTLWTHTDVVVGVVFHPTNGQIAAAAAGGVVRVWDIDSARDIAAWQIGENLRIETLAYSPDGRILATGDKVDGLRLWDVSKSYARYEVLRHYPVHVEAVSFSSNGRLIALANADYLAVLRVDSGQLVANLTVPGANIRSVCFLSDNRTLALAGDPAATGLLDWTTGEFWNAFDSTVPSWCAACSKDGHWLALAEKSGALKVWDGSARRNFYRIDVDSTQTAETRSSLAADGHHLAVAHLSTGVLTVWDIEQSIPTRRDLQLAPSGAGHEIDDITFVPNGNTIAVGMTLSPSETGIILADAKTGEVLARSLGRRNDAQLRVQHLMFSPDGSTLIARYGDKTDPGSHILLYDLATGDVRRTIPLRPTKAFWPLPPMAISSVGDVFAISNFTDDGQSQIALHRFSDEKKVVQCELLPILIHSLSFTRDGQFVIVDGGAGHISFVDASTGMIAKRIHLTGIPPVAAERAMAVSFDGRTIALASTEGIALADIEAETTLCTLPFPRTMIRVNDVSIAADATAVTAVATAADGSTGVYVWLTSDSKAQK